MHSKCTAQCCLWSKHNSSVSQIFNGHCWLGEKRKDTWIYEVKKYKALEKSLKNRELYLPKLVDCRTTWFYCVWRCRRRNLLTALAQCTVSHFQSSSWFLSSLISTGWLFITTIRTSCPSRASWWYVVHCSCCGDIFLRYPRTPVCLSVANEIYVLFYFICHTIQFKINFR